MQLTTWFSIIHSLVESVYRGNKQCMVGCNLPEISQTLQIHTQMKHHNTRFAIKTHNCRCLYPWHPWTPQCASSHIMREAFFVCLSLWFPLSLRLSLLIVVQINRVSLRHRPLHWNQLFQELCTSRGCFLWSLPDFCIPQNVLDLTFALVNMFILLNATIMSWMHDVYNKSKLVRYSR